jgi:hypothetical protein
MAAFWRTPKKRPEVLAVPDVMERTLEAAVPTQIGSQQIEP